MNKKLDRREAARKEAEKIAAKQSAADNRTRNILIAAIGVVVILLGFVAWMLVKESQKTLLSEFEGVAPAAGDLNGGISFGGPNAVAGETNPGATDLAVYADYLCSFCGLFEQANGPDIRAMVESGDATLIYHPVNLLDRTGETGYSTITANAFVEVVENAPELALDFSDALFANQPAEGSQLPTLDDIKALAESVGVSADVTAKFDAGTYIDWVNVAWNQARRDGVTGTPSVAVNGTMLQQGEVDFYTPGNLKAFVLDKSGK